MDEHQEPLLAPEALDREKALTLCAVAARAWAARQTEPAGGSTRELLRQVMHAASWTCRARAHHGASSLGIADVIEFFGQPLGVWLPGAPDFPLLDEGAPTPLCLELAEEAGPAPLTEIEQRVILKVMDHLAGTADAAARYAAFRRFLIEHATVTEGEAARTALSAGVTLAELYGPIPVGAKIQRGGVDHFYPCPRCGWPMQLRGNGISCAHSASCLEAGARYRLEGADLLALGRLPPRAPRACSGVAALRPGLWRYTTLPGLEEVALAERLSALPGVEVELWPFLDRYDLDVRKGSDHWRIDVKDHVSVTGLARRLVERPTDDVVWIVVPDTRREQAPLLGQLVPADRGYRFAYSSELVRRVGSTS